MFKSIFALALLAGIALAPALAAAAPIATEAPPLVFATPAATRVAVLTDAASLAPGARFRLAVIIDHPAHHHTYWQNPGDSGTSTEISWQSTAGVTFSPLRFPGPILLNQSGTLAFVHEGRTTLLAEGLVPATAKPGDTLALAGSLSWLLCDDSSCLPGDAEVALKLTVAETTTPANSAYFEAALAALPDPVAVRARLSPAPGKDAITLEIPANALTGRDPATARFFPLNDGLPEGETHPSAFALVKPESGATDSLRFTLPGATTAMKHGVLRGLVTFATGRPVAIDATPATTPAVAPAVVAATATTAPGPQITPPAPAEGKLSLAEALLLALGGGLLLNIMPCVFPVLGLKIYGFVNKAGGDARSALRHGLAFAAGIVISFWILAGALIAARGIAASLLGAQQNELGWGFLMQMPGFNALIAILFLVMALGMCGVFEFGTGVQNAAGAVREREGYFGSFLSGALATIVATPCSGPGMAPAITFAIGATAFESFAVFTALALGLAAPFVILSASPKLLAKLPRPGAWMESFKQGMSFLLFASFAYFVWILAGQLDEQPLLFTFGAFVTIAFGVWIYGRWATPEKSDRTRRNAKLIAAVLTLGATGFIFTQFPKSATAQPATAEAAPEITWSAWSPAAQAAALAAGKTVYVDFTARWCLICQANKHVYHVESVKRAFADHQVVALKADWGKRDATIAAELKKYDRVAIPFNVVLHKDRPPVALPPTLTAAAVSAAVSGK